MRVGVIGCGVIGSVLVRACREKGFEVSVYDKFKLELGTFDEVLKTEIVFLCLPTPTSAGQQDTAPIRDTCAALSAQEYTGAVVIRSTVLPGTTTALGVAFPRLKLVHNPEFLTAANAYRDLLAQGVVLLGSSSKEALDLAFAFWASFDKDLAFRGFTDPSTTEMAKYIHNLFLSVKVSFFNDIYEVCQKQGLNFLDSVLAACSLGQIGFGHTKVPGPDGKSGFGGTCFPKDTVAFLDWGKSLGLGLKTLQGAVDANYERRPEDMNKQKWRA